MPLLTYNPMAILQEPDDMPEYYRDENGQIRIRRKRKMGSYDKKEVITTSGGNPEGLATKGIWPWK